MSNYDAQVEHPLNTLVALVFRVALDKLLDRQEGLLAKLGIVQRADNNNNNNNNKVNHKAPIYDLPLCQRLQFFFDLCAGQSELFNLVQNISQKGSIDQFEQRADWGVSLFVGSSKRECLEIGKMHCSLLLAPPGK